MPTPDEAFLGSIIVSFQTTTNHNLTPGSQITQHTIGFALLVGSGAVDIVKLFPPNVKGLSNKILDLLIHNPRINHFPDFSNQQPLPGFKEALWMQFASNPETAYLKNIPQVPEAMQEMRDSQYVKNVHVQSYSEIMKFDFSFLDGSTKRYSLIPRVALYLQRALDKASEIIDLKA